MVSGGIVLWFTYSVVNTVARSLLGVAETPFLARLGSQGLGILAAVLVLLAYLPPRYLREKFGVRSILEETAREKTTQRQAQHALPRLLA